MLILICAGVLAIPLAAFVLLDEHKNQVPLVTDTCISKEKILNPALQLQAHNSAWLFTHCSHM